MFFNQENKEKDTDNSCENKDFNEQKINENQLNNKEEDKKKEVLENNKLIETLQKEIDKLKIENDLLKIRINELNENYKKQVLEKANQAQQILNENIDKLKEKYQNEFKDRQKYALEKDAIKLIDVINNFDIALKHSPQDPQIKNYVTGFKMISNMFQNLLNDLNIKKIEIKPGDTFNHDYMEALEHIYSDKYKSNQVIEVLKPAYKLHDHIISFAKVTVAK